MTSDTEVITEEPKTTGLERTPYEERQYKSKWWRRSKDRGIYHETEFIKRLTKAGWNKGRRIPVSGPFLGWTDCLAVKDEPDKYVIGLFQLKPRKKTYSAYFSGKQVLSLLMLESMFATSSHSNIIQIDKVLVGILKGGIVYHQLTPEDVLHVGLTDSVFSRISLTDPIGATKVMQHMPSPKSESRSGKPLTNFYDYLGSMNVVLNIKDQSNWQP